jgi:Phage integrase family
MRSVAPPGGPHRPLLEGLPQAAGPPAVGTGPGVGGDHRDQARGAVGPVASAPARPRRPPVLRMPQGAPPVRRRSPLHPWPDLLSARAQPVLPRPRLAPDHRGQLLVDIRAVRADSEGDMGGAIREVVKYCTKLTDAGALRERRPRPPPPLAPVGRAALGEPRLPPYVVRHAFTLLLRRPGLRSVRFHDLRHTAATLLLSRCVHPKIVSEMLGHATIAITLDLPSHVTPPCSGSRARAGRPAAGEPTPREWRNQPRRDNIRVIGRTVEGATASEDGGC